MRLWQTIQSDWTYPDIFREQSYNGVRIFVAGDEFPKLWFVGDSHVEQYSSRIKALSTQTKQSVGMLTAGGCFVGIGVVPPKNLCKDVVRAFERLIADPRVHTIVWGQKWGAYAHRGVEFGFSYKIPEGFILPLSEEYFAQTLENTSQLIVQRNKRLFLLLDAPWDEETGRFHPMQLLSRLPWKKALLQDFVVDIPTTKPWQVGNEIVRQRVTSGGVIIDPVKQVCPNQKCNLLNYKDDDHLRASYLRDHATWIDPTFQH